MLRFKQLCYTLIIATSALGAVVNLAPDTVAYGGQQSAAMGRQTGADNEYQTGAILWQQTSGEYRALAYQAFHLAQVMFDQDLRQQRRNRRARAVVVDVDETVLDNSRFQAELVLKEQPYDQQGWHSWCERAEATAIPGAVEFLQYATRRGARIFYVTNRRTTEKPCTVKNLQRMGFPGVRTETVMVREEGTSASKESRRQLIATRYRIVLLMGDNLNDFSDLFAGKGIPDRAAAVDQSRAQFGTRFIVLPNPMYGDWENSVYDNKPGLSDAEKRARRRAALKGL